MCGIVGIVGTRPVAPLLIEALKRLEYRGYDSAGVSTLENGKLERVRAEGKLYNLDHRVSKAPMSGALGIGHTRWATHGAPTETNAHPHMTARVSVVHNGIIENFRELREALEADGYRFETETDTEVVTQLITRELDRGAEPLDAVRNSLSQVEGAFALAIIFAGHSELMIAAREGSPLAVGHGVAAVLWGRRQP